MDGAAARSQQPAQTPATDTDVPTQLAIPVAEQPPLGDTGGQGLAEVLPLTREPVYEPVVGPELSQRELEILAFERQWWKYAGAKEDAIKAALGLSATRYYQVLNALIDRPEALRADPMLVKRLRRLRAGRQKARAARRLGFTIT